MRHIGVFYDKLLQDYVQGTWQSLSLYTHTKKKRSFFTLCHESDFLSHLSYMSHVKYLDLYLILIFLL
jgi:hypothetical protein